MSEKPTGHLSVVGAAVLPARRPHGWTVGVTWPLARLEADRGRIRVRLRGPLAHLAPPISFERDEVIIRRSMLGLKIQGRRRLHNFGTWIWFSPVGRRKRVEERLESLAGAKE